MNRVGCYRGYVTGLIGFVVCLLFVAIAYFDVLPRRGSDILKRDSFVCHEVQNVSKSGKREKHWECNDPDEHEPTEPYLYIYAPSIEHPRFVRMMQDQERLQDMMCRGEKSLNAIIFTCEGTSCPGVSPQGMEGLLLTYLIAVLTKRAFLIHTPTWLKLEDYLAPVFKLDKKTKRKLGVDWRIHKCKGAMKRASELQSALYPPLDLRLPHGVGCPQASRLLHEEVSIIALMAEDSRQLCAYELLKVARIEMPKWRFEPVYSRIFQELFEFSKEIRKSVDKFMLDHELMLDHRTICFNVETRQVPGRSPGAKHRNIEDFWRCGRWLERGADMANELHSDEFVKIPRNHSHYVWVVVSDHEAVPESAERWLFQRNVYRRIISTVAAGYIRPSPDQRNVQLKHTFIELLLLSRCNKYVSSHSAYSMMAASLYPKFDEKIYVKVEMEAVNHALPLREVCIRQRGGWGADLYEQEDVN